MPDILVALGLVALGVFLAIGIYLIVQASISDELDARGMYGTKGRPKK